MRTHIALLRGINVGGHHKLPMKELAAIFAGAGCDDVRTYIQSGNVVFSAEATVAEQVPTRVAAGVLDRFGFEVPIVTRTAEELAAIVEANPFASDDIDERFLHVAFLLEEPDTEAVATLDPDYSPPDDFAVNGREIYLRYPNGLARSKLTNAWFDRRLGTVSTVRNWRTTKKLLEMTEG